MRVFALVLAVIFTSSAASAASSVELRELKHICAGLVGHQLFSSSWNQLRPYLRDPQSLDVTHPVFCGITCSDSLILRHGYRLDFVWVNTQHMGPWKADDAIVQSVILRRGKEELFRRGFFAK